GYKVSPILWKTIYSGLSAGRVQSVALRLIVERDREIELFVTEEYWVIKVLLATQKNEEFEAKLLKKDGKELKIKNSDESEAVVKELSELPFIVKNVTKKKKKRHASPPFITSTLQQEAAGRLGFAVSRTMRVAQSLYEGVELKDVSAGLITYMRTDSTRIAPEAIEEVRAYIVEKWGRTHLPPKPNLYRSKKGAQDAHEAIRPASISRPPEKVKAYLSSEQMKLYTLIWNKFVASQMKSAEYSLVTVDITAEKYELRSNARHLDYEGFLAAYMDIKKENNDEESPVLELPALAGGDKLKHKETIPSQHFTKPPPCFNEASLVKELEARGIGRPSTYAQIINIIQTRKYVQREKRKLQSTELGRSVNKILVSQFPDVFSADFTANMENDLDKVESGDNEWRDVVNEFYVPFNKSLERFENQRHELKESLIEKTDELCDKCGKPMVIRWGRNGKFMACSGFPSCKNTRSIDEQETEKTDEVCEKCGSPMEVKKGKYGRFLGCSKYPECKNIKPYSLGVKCPLKSCEGEMVEKKSKKGKIFYGCSRYPDCKFASWTLPVSITCPNCGCPTLVETKNGESCSCPRCRSTFDLETLKK
ncbi:MAG: type I DNA topoisomerase, partial [Candidatus Latescibacteria bacterium]|nr:type I DNA topoisomerase [Candidatus Latescibacterota bacterium]